MKFLFFLTLSALIGALYALYAPKEITPIVKPVVSSGLSDELRLVEARINDINEKMRQLTGVIETGRREMNNAFEDIANRTPSLKGNSSWDDKFPEESPIIRDPRLRSSLLGFGGLELRADKIRKLVAELAVLKNESTRLMQSKATLSAKIQAEKRGDS